MSPAVVDFGSPIVSPQQIQAKQQPPSVQEPIPNTGIPLDYGAFSSHRPSGQYQGSSHADSNITTASSLDNANEGGFNCAFTSKFGSRTSSEKSNLSSFSCRSRPRLVKVRKQSGSQHGRPTTVPAENASGLNPFISTSEGSDRVKAANVTSNGFGVSVSDARFGKFDNVSFAFVANSCNSSSNPNKEERESCENAGQLNADGVGNFENEGFGGNKNIAADVSRKLKHEDFGANKNISILKLNLERMQSSERTEQSGDDVGFVFGAKKSDSASNSKLIERKVNESMGLRASEFGKFNNVNFVFGANMSDLVSNSKSFSDNSSNLAFSKMSEKRELSESATKATAYEFGNFDHVSVISGTNKSNFKSEEREIVSDSEQASSASILEPPTINSTENVGNFDDAMDKLKEDVAIESSKLNNAGSIFVANQRDMEKKESGEIAEKLAPDVKGKTRLDTGADSVRLDGSWRVFGQDLHELESNSNLGKGKSGENVGKSASIDSGRITSEAQLLGTLNNVSFVFGAYQSGSASQPDLGNRNSSEITGGPDFEKKGDVGVDTGKAFLNTIPSSVLTFESGSKKNSSFSGDAKVNDDMDKVNNDSSGDFADFANLHTDYLGSGVGINCNFSFEGHINRANMSEAGPVFSLFDEMKKLNIDANELIGGCGKTFNSNTNPNATNVFVFGSNKESFSSAGISGTAYCHQTTNKVYPLYSGTFDKTGKVNPKTSDKNAFLFANSKDTVCSFSGGVENVMPDDMKNKNTRMVGAMDEQVNFESLSQNKEQPINFNEKKPDNPSVEISTPKPFIFQAGSDKSFNGPPDQLNDDMKLNKVSFKSSLSSTSLGFDAGSASKVENKDMFSFTITPNSRRKNLDASCSFTMNLFPGLNKKLEFGAKSRAVREQRLKRTMRKLRQATLLQQQSRKDQVSKGGVSEHFPESPGYYSPMDFSPYQDGNCISSTGSSTFSIHAKDECLVTERERADGNEDNEKCGEPNEKGSKNCGERHCFADFLWEQFVSGADTEHHNAEIEQVCTKSGAGVAEAGSGVSSNMKKEESDSRKQFNFASSSEDTGKREFAFSSSSSQANLSAVKRQYRKKYRMKVGQGTTCTVPNQKVEFASLSVQFLPLASPSSHLNGAQDRKEDICKPQSKGENKSKADEERAKQGSATAATQEACENWRIRGNKAYKNGYLSKAEEFYTKGVNSVPHNRPSGCCFEPLVLCYSNRAAARMSLGRMREALWDCVKAAELDPDFLKVQIRAANCHLALGEVENVMKYFNKCLESGSGVCLDRRVMIEAADGIQKAQKVAECRNQCAELLQQRTSDAATRALGKTVEALSISPYSEKLLEMKGEAFFILRRFEEVIQLCKETLDFAEKNFSVVAFGYDLENMDASKFKNPLVMLWRWRLMSKSYFHLGRLEVALDLLEKHELLRSSNDRCESTTQGSSIPLAVTVRELVHCKNAGNEAFQSGCHAEAVDQYTAAISSSIESRPFAAICFCNRAAAHQALGQIADAIADCSLAIAFDGKYPKAVSRRATLHETIRDYEQAAIDIQKLICVLERHSHEKVQHSGTPDGPTDSNVKELRRAHRRLSAMEEKAKKGTSLDLYLILGVKASDTASEIKKAYRKAALRHHPDKAGQFLVRSESGDDGQIWKEIAEDVHKDADRLFKMIGEAYAVLSDPTKRSEYDLQEELRRARMESNGSSSSRRPSDFYSPPFQSSSNRRSWRGSQW